MLPIVKFNTYKNVRIGSCVDYDGAYWYQCVDLMRHYAQYAEYPPITNRWNAIQLWDKWLWSWYTKVINWINNKPPVWAIVFWKQWEFGHVAIAWRSNYFWMEVLEQNWWSGNWDGRWNNAIRIRKDYFHNCLWWFIPNV